MKEKHKRAYMKTARNFAECSTAKRMQVGAIVVKDDSIISIGYNGTPKGWTNDCEVVELMDWASSQQLEPDRIAAEWPYESRFWIDGREVITRYRLKTRPEVMHAERNALDKLAKSGNAGGDGAAMFITHAPCLECAKSIYGAGIREVYYEQDYRSTDGIDFLKKCGIAVERVDID